MLSSIEKNKAKKVPTPFIILNEDVRVEFTEKANFVQRPGDMGSIPSPGKSMHMTTNPVHHGYWPHAP